MDATRPRRILKSCGRRTHRKSRNGCRNCKRRKIKCGEEKPSCLNCITGSKICEFGPSACFSHSAFPNCDESSRTGGSPSCPLHTLQLPDLNVLDLELLHNYSTSTSLSISSDPVMQLFWRIQAPQIGFSNDYVMRGILAVSAVHLARIYPEREDIFIPYAIQQHETALREATTILSKRKAENCEALHLLSVMTCIYTLGSLHKAVGFVGSSGLSEWLFLFRGIKTIIDSASDQLYVGSLAPLLQAAQKRLLLRETSFIGVVRLTELRQLVSETRNNKSRTQLYMLLIEDLEKSFSVVYGCPSGTCEAADVFIWHSHLSDDYLLLLQGGAPEALVIFAHSCVLFRKLEFLWWMEGWSVYFISHIYDLLDEEHRLWIRWPVEQIGWVPPYNRRNN